jgi:hypothetical protein
MLVTDCIDLVVVTAMNTCRKEKAINSNRWTDEISQYPFNYKPIIGMSCLLIKLQAIVRQLP